MSDREIMNAKGFNSEFHPHHNGVEFRDPVVKRVVE